MTAPTPPGFDEWCVVEQLGHRRIAARVREVTLAGAGMLRLDEPATEGHDPRTQYVSPASVYAIHLTTLEAVTAMAARWRTEPVARWELPANLRPAIEADADDYDREDDGHGPF